MDFPQPLQFPDPIIYDCSEEVLDLELGDGIMGRARTLISSSNMAFEIVRSLSNSIYGEVMCGFMLTMGDLHYKRTDMKVAIKKYDRSRLPGGSNYVRMHENPMQEISAMQYLQNPGHSNVVSYIESTQHDTHLFTVMEFVDRGELFSALKSEMELNRRFSENLVRIYFKQIVAGLSYIQSRDMCHRDLSLENVLLSTTGRVVIIDFGMSILLPRALLPDGTTEISKISPQGFCGKKNYAAPEIYNGRIPFNGYASDIWGLGIILFTLAVGTYPYEVPNRLDQCFRIIMEGNLEALLHAWRVQLSTLLIDLIKRILKVNPTERLTLQQIQQHSWMNI